MDNISKVILDDSQYTSRVEAIAQAWSDAADQEERAAQVSSSAVKKRVDDLNVLDQNFVNHMNTVKQTQAAETTRVSATETASRAQGRFTTTLQKTRTRLTGYISSLKKAKKSEQELAAEKARSKAIYQESLAGLKAEIGATTILGTNLGQLGRVIKAARILSMAWIRTLGVLKVALISTGIGAIVVVLGSLVAYLTSTIEGADFLNRKLAAVGAVVASVKDVFINFGKTVFDAISNPVSYTHLTLPTKA